MDQNTMLSDVAKAAPPGGALVASHFFNVTLPIVIQVCTAIYAVGLVVQMGWRLYKFVREQRAKGEVTKLRDLVRHAIGAFRKSSGDT
jgi:hypothetical protein